MKQTVCPGWRGRPCPNAASPGPQSFCASAIRKRHGRPWRCRLCTSLRTGELKRGDAHWNRRVQVCPSGHPYDEANTLRYTQPGERERRYCRTCRRERQRIRQRIRTVERRLVRAATHQAPLTVFRRLQRELAALRKQYPGKPGHPGRFR
jgi:hypothetical protein